MVVLRSKTHLENRPQKVDMRSTARQNNSNRPAKSRSSPRRTRNEGVKEDERTRVPTPLTEKKNEENSHTTERNMTMHSKLDSEASQTNARKNLRDEARSPYPQRKSKEKTTKKTKSTRGKGKRHDVDKNWEEYSPPATQDSLEDEYPMIIQCWQ